MKWHFLGDDIFFKVKNSWICYASFLFKRLTIKNELDFHFNANDIVLKIQMSEITLDIILPKIKSVLFKDMGIKDSKGIYVDISLFFKHFNDKII